MFRVGGQLTTQKGLVAVVGPGQYSDYLGKGTSYCKYDTIATDPFAVTTGEATDLGPVDLPHLPASEQDGAQCYPTS